MTSIWIVVSFLLNVVAIFAIVILYVRQNKLLQVEKNQKKVMNEMEEMISTYLLEMKDENEKFLARATKLREYGDQSVPFMQEERQMMDTVEINSSFVKGKAVNVQAVNAYKNQSNTLVNDPNPLPPLIIDEEDSSEWQTEAEEIVEKAEPQHETLFDHVMDLKQQGFSIDEIAKKLHKGKTEIELLVKFNEKK